jgi:antitoxin MazE
MLAKAHQWGNSLAVRIPKVIAEECGISADTDINIVRDKGNIILMPVVKKKYSMADLLSQVTDENIHAEVKTGRPVGKEIW